MLCKYLSGMICVQLDKSLANCRPLNDAYWHFLRKASAGGKKHNTNSFSIAMGIWQGSTGKIQMSKYHRI